MEFKDYYQTLGVPCEATAEESQGFSPHEAAEFSDFFAKIFGGMGGAPGNTHARSGSHRAQGEDHHAKVVPDIEDSFIGVIVLNTPFPSGVSA